MTHVGSSALGVRGLLEDVAGRELPPARLHVEDQILRQRRRGGLLARPLGRRLSGLHLDDRRRWRSLGEEAHELDLSAPRDQPGDDPRQRDDENGPNHGGGDARPAQPLLRVRLHAAIDHRWRVLTDQRLQVVVLEQLVAAREDPGVGGGVEDEVVLPNPPLLGGGDQRLAVPDEDVATATGDAVLLR